MHEFSLLEYNVRGYLAYLLAVQRERPLETYKEQFRRFVEFISDREITLNEKISKNPDVQWMDAELTVANVPSFGNCLDQILAAAEEVDFPKIEKLHSLVKELKEANRQRNILTHSVWHEAGEKVALNNFPDYHKGKWLFIKGGGERLTPKPLEEWTLQKLEDFIAHLRDLHERLENIFQR